MKREHSSDDVVHDSTGNVFADLGLNLSEDDLLKVHIAHAISKIVQGGDYTQARAATIMGIDQPKVSKLLRGRLKDFSVERLMLFLNLLGYDIEVRVQKAVTRKRGRVRLVA